MWHPLLDLLRAVRRPLVVVDYETCGLTGEPPVEMCFLVFSPWAPPEMDADTLAARALLPPQIAADLTHCVTTRLNPRCRIPAEATAIHRIGDRDVADAPPFDDEGVLAYVRSLATGNGTGDPQLDRFDASADHVGAAVWCGHNIAGFDIPHMRHWGHLPSLRDYESPRGEAPDHAAPCFDVLDTDCLVRRLSAEHPYPLSPDAITTPGSVWHRRAEVAAKDIASAEHAGDMRMVNDHDVWAIAGPPAVGHGLTPYRSSLEGCRLSLLGESPDDTTHGAVVDCCLSVRVLHACLELWSPLWSVAVGAGAVGPEDSLARLVAALGAPPTDRRTGARQIAWDGWLEVDQTKTQAAVNAAALTRVVRGKHKGRPLADVAKRDPSYLTWMLGLGDAPNVVGDQWTAPATKAALQAARAPR